MSPTEFFYRIDHQYKTGLPFVAYRKPGSTMLKAIFQEDVLLHNTTTLEETGFVFAPFEAVGPKILIKGKSLEVYFELTERKSELLDIKIPLIHSEREDYIKLIKKAVSKIKSSELKKVVLSRKQVLSDMQKDPNVIFQELLKTYPQAFCYFFYHPQIGVWLGATPETLLSSNGRSFQTMALAGTQRYEGRMDVKWGVKEQEEQQFVVDEITSQLKELGIDSLNISTTQTHRAGSLLHLLSKIKGSVDCKKQTLSQIINALHPTPAVCGLPRDDAKKFILKNENYNREYYTGFLGELNFEEKIQRSRNKRNVENLAYKTIRKTSDLYVNLRCMQLKDSDYHVYIGGGVTASSIPEKEWEETVNKAQTMARVLHSN